MLPKTITLGTAVLLIAGAPGAAAETERAGAAEVVAKVQQAATLIEREGDAAFAILANPLSGFVWKDTYVFVVNCDADRVMANPAFPERVGGDIKQHTDYADKKYGLELCEVAANGGGWVEYVWLQPGGSVPMRKISYVISPEGSPYQIGAGIYGDNKTLDELNQLHDALAR